MQLFSEEMACPACKREAVVVPVNLARGVSTKATCPDCGWQLAVVLAILMVPPKGLLGVEVDEQQECFVATARLGSPRQAARADAAVEMEAAKCEP